MKTLTVAAAAAMFLASQPSEPDMPALARDSLTAPAPAAALPVLSQRIAKAYCQAGLGVMPEESAKQLEESVTRFESGLKRLRQQYPDSGRQKPVAALEAAWVPFKAVATGPVTRPGCALLLVQSEAMVRMSKGLDAGAGTPTGDTDAWLANAANRQAELSQRLATLYLARAAGVESATLRDEIHRASAEFSATLSALQLAQENTPGANRHLEDVAVQWEWLRSALNQEAVPAAYPLVVAEASDAILRGMESVAREYQELP